jgi:dephospho-CoA kinase
MTRTIGLTGGIGSGKSTVAKIFETLGACVIDADAIVHELQGPGQPLTAAIAEAFGPRVLRRDGGVDRQALGAQVFSDAQERQKLNRLVHPRVGAEMARRVDAARKAGVPVIVLDIPLLMEARGDVSAAALLGIDTIVVVSVPFETQLERLMERNGLSREEAFLRVSAQMPLSDKRRLADHVIDNSGTLAETERRVRSLWNELLGKLQDPAETTS